MLILLPATTGGIAKSLQLYCEMAGREAPEFLPGLLALLITATIAGIGKVWPRCLLWELCWWPTLLGLPLCSAGVVRASQPWCTARAWG